MGSGGAPTGTGRSVDVCVVGGAGHVGLPLSILLAAAGQRVLIYDVAEKVLERLRRGEMPFVEYDADPLLRKFAGKTLTFTSDRAEVARARMVIMAIGTPVDEFLNPNLRALLDLFASLQPFLRPEQTIIIRSTVYPGTCRRVQAALARDGREWHLAYCPERIAQGYAVRELKELPQLVSGLTGRAAGDAAALFGRIAPKIIRVSVEEAELAKLFSNAWRYIQFAATNQFYMMATDFGADYDQVRRAMVEGYGRASSLPAAGFAAGPCLLKDTMQLAAFNLNHFALGQAAMNINEGLPNYLVMRLARRRDLSRTRVGILGMAFKGDIDDTRDSLSYKLGKILRFHGAEVLYSDEYAVDPTFISKEDLVARSEVVIVGAPHSAYRSLRVPPSVERVDLWGILPPAES